MWIFENSRNAGKDNGVLAGLCPANTPYLFHLYGDFHRTIIVSLRFYLAGSVKIHI